MKDLRAEYKKKFEATTEKEKQFRSTECNGCGIWLLRDHAYISGDCKYLIPAEIEVVYRHGELVGKVTRKPLTINVAGVRCALVDSKNEQD